MPAPFPKIVPESYAAGKTFFEEGGPLATVVEKVSAGARNEMDDAAAFSYLIGFLDGVLGKLRNLP